jgi:hypothetical protein
MDSHVIGNKWVSIYIPSRYADGSLIPNNTIDSVVNDATKLMQYHNHLYLI